MVFNNAGELEAALQAGFTFYATRTILSGEADELIELAQASLRDLEIE